MKKRLPCILLAAILLSSSALAVTRLHFGASVGTSSLFSSDSSYWTGGFSFGCKVAYELSQNLHLGASIAYLSVSPDMPAIEKYIDADRFTGDFSRSYLELIPYIAFYPNGDKAGIFLQAGAGLVISQGNINVNTYNDYYYFTTTYSYKKEFSNFCPAAMLGGGFRFPIGEKLSIEVKIEGRVVATPAEGYPAGTKAVWAGNDHRYFSLGIGFLY
jgi:hypothetical protein